MKDTLSKSTEIKLKHAKILEDLTNIINNGPAPRVNRPIARVTPSEDTTAPRVVRAAPRIHQRRTRKNNPMPPIIEETIQNENADQNKENLDYNSDKYYSKPRKTEKQNGQKKKPKILKLNLKSAPKIPTVYTLSSLRRGASPPYK